MERANQLIVAMADHCRQLLQTSAAADAELPTGLQPRHLRWMCDKIVEHAEDWPATKLHRWIGFVQGVMLANRSLDIDSAKSMYEAAKSNYRDSLDDQDLCDHLDPANAFRLDLGGQG